MSALDQVDISWPPSPTPPLQQWTSWDLFKFIFISFFYSGPGHPLLTSPASPPPPPISSEWGPPELHGDGPHGDLGPPHLGPAGQEASQWGDCHVPGDLLQAVGPRQRGGHELYRDLPGPCRAGDEHGLQL